MDLDLLLFFLPALARSKPPTPAAVPTACTTNKAFCNLPNVLTVHLLSSYFVTGCASLYKVLKLASVLHSIAAAVVLRETREGLGYGLRV